jgi:glycosyltransferase involved in cell wall biosynthesis
MSAHADDRRPLVSIGLPVYNGERFLAEALRSNLEQTVEDLELIVCDNASDDGTAEIVEEFAARDPRVRYHRHKRNLGAAANYNSTVELARGRFFRWTTHDDLVAPTHAERLLEVYDDGPPDLALVYSKTAIIDADGEVVGQYDDRLDARSPRAHVRLRSMLRNLSLCNPVVGLTPLETIRSTGLIGPFRSSDKVFLYEMAMRGPMIEVPERLFLRRRDESLASPSNLSADGQAAWFDPARVRTGYRSTLVRNCFAAVRRAGLSWPARWRCHMTMARDAVRWRRELLAELRAGRPKAEAAG